MGQLSIGRPRLSIIRPRSQGKHPLRPSPTGARPLGYYLDKTSVASFPLPRISSLRAGWAGRVLIEEDVRSPWRKGWLQSEPQCAFLCVSFSPPHGWVGHHRWGSGFLGRWALSGVQRRSSTKGCSSRGSHLSSPPQISLGPPSLAEARSVVKGGRQESHLPFGPAWPSPASRPSQAASFRPTGC